MDADEAAELLERSLVVVHAQVDEDVREPRVALLGPDDEDRGRLLPAAVSTRRLRGVEAVEEPLHERLAGGCLEGVREPVHRLRGDEDVPLRRVPVADASARPLVALVARVARAAPLAVDDPELALGAVLVGRGQALDHLVGGNPFAEQREPFGPVPRVRPRLRRDRAHERLGPGNDRADAEELRLHRDAPLPRLEVAGADRVRRDEHAPTRT